MNKLIIRVGVVLLFLVIGAIGGHFIGGFLSKHYIPLWNKTNVYSSLTDVEEILYVIYRDTINENIEIDTIYVKTSDGAIKSLINNQITLLDPIPSGLGEFVFEEHKSISGYVTVVTDGSQFYELNGIEWHQIDDVGKLRPIKDFPPCNEWNVKPPIGRNIKDSGGVIMERPLSTLYRCYVVGKNGKLYAWTRFYGVYDLFLTLGVSTVVGSICFGVLGFESIKRKK